MEVGTIKFTWKIKNFSKLNVRKLYSEVFSFRNYKWQIGLYPKGYNVDHLSIYLEVADLATLPSGWRRNTKFSLAVVNQKYRNLTVRLATEKKFNALDDNWGWSKFIPLKELHDVSKGYLVQDTCIIEAEVTMLEDVAIESESTGKDTPQQEVAAFFVNLESQISSHKSLFQREEVEEALSMIESTNPTDLNDPGRISQIKNALDVLSTLDDYYLCTAEQNAQLRTIKEKFNDLAERAARAVKDKSLLKHKEFVKVALGRKLEKCQVDFQKVKEQNEEQEQSIAAIQGQVNALKAQIGEAQKKKDNFLSKQKEMFDLSKVLKAELNVLEKQWPEYEARMKAAEEEERKVGTEWQKMKQFVSSLKKPLYLKPNYV